MDWDEDTFLEEDFPEILEEEEEETEVGHFTSATTTFIHEVHHYACDITQHYMQHYIQ